MSTSGHGAVKWEYFDAFEDIFVSDKSVNIGPSISSTEPFCSYSSNSMDASSNFNLSEDDYSMERIIIQSSSSSTPRCKRLREERESRNEIEKIKLQKLTEISESLKERNALFKEFVETYKKNSEKK